MIVLFSKHYLLKTSSTLSLKILILSQYGKIDLKYFLRLGRKLARHAIQLWVIQTVVRKPNLVLILGLIHERTKRSTHDVEDFRTVNCVRIHHYNVIKKVALSRSEMISFSVNIFVLLFTLFTNPLTQLSEIEKYQLSC